MCASPTSSEHIGLGIGRTLREFFASIINAQCVLELLHLDEQFDNSGQACRLSAKDNNYWSR